MHGFCYCVLWILQFCIVDFAIEQLRQLWRCNRRYPRSSTLGHTMMLVLLSDGVVLRQTWKIYIVCSSSRSEDIFKHSWSHYHAGAERWSMDHRTGDDGESGGGEKEGIECFWAGLAGKLQFSQGCIKFRG